MSKETNEAQQMFKLRTQVAMKALQGILASPIAPANDYKEYVTASFKYADEFIKQLGRTK